MFQHVTDHLLNGIWDKDEGNEAGETFLCEAGHIFDDVAGVWDDQQKALQTRVQTDPQTELHVVYVIVPGREVIQKKEKMVTIYYWVFNPLLSSRRTCG